MLLQIYLKTNFSSSSYIPSEYLNIALQDVRDTAWVLTTHVYTNFDGNINKPPLQSECDCINTSHSLYIDGFVQDCSNAGAVRNGVTPVSNQAIYIWFIQFLHSMLLHLRYVGTNVLTQIVWIWWNLLVNPICLFNTKTTDSNYHRSMWMSSSKIGYQKTGVPDIGNLLCLLCWVCQRNGNTKAFRSIIGFLKMFECASH